MRPIEFLNYDKLTDVIYDIGFKTVLELVVSLSRKNETTLDRYHFHREFKYPTKYSDTMYSMKRSFDYYLNIRRTDSHDNLGIMIRVQDMYLVINKLKDALNWFETGIYGMRKNKELYIKVKQNSILIPELAAGKYIQLDPVVITYENTGVQIQGIRMTLGNPDIYTDVSIDRFYGLYYILSNLDLFGVAQNLVNYLGRPEYGTNLREFESGNFRDPVEEKEDMITGVKDNRTISSNKRPQSFFDKIDKLM